MSDVEFLRAAPEQPPAVEQPGPPVNATEEPPPTRRRRGRPRGALGARSLTARLSIGVVLLVIVLVALVSAGTYVALRPYLNDRLNQQVTLVASQNAQFFDSCFERGQGVPGTNQVNCNIYGRSAPLSQDEWIAFITPDGTQGISLNPPATNGGPSYEPLTLSPALLAQIVSDPSGAWRVRYGGHELVLRAQAIRFDGIIVVTGLSTEDVNGTLHQVLMREFLIGLAAVVLALIATTFGVSFGLRKLRRVTNTANAVAAELSPTGAGLDTRVDVPDDGTEVGQLAESMNTLLSAVQTQFNARLESEARLRQFLADASHELRTPLTSIRGYAELARMQRAAGDTSDDNLSRIESEGMRMSRLVEDLLMLARGEQPSQQEPVRELVDVADLVEGAASDVRAANPERRITTDAAGGLQVLGDSDQLLRAVRNLVSNAAMHTAPERPIHVRSVPDGTFVLIQVIDGGPGLPPEEAAHVFERFWRADKARSRARGGTGLGMSIVAAIVANHGGTVRFDSSVEAGSTVSIWLPSVQYSPQH